MTADTMDAAREGEGKNENMKKKGKKCLNLKSKRTQSSRKSSRLPPRNFHLQLHGGSLMLVVVVGGYADGASEHPNPETL